MNARIFASLAGLTLLTVMTPAQPGDEPAAPEQSEPEAGPQPTSEQPNGAGAAAVLYGQNDWRILVSPFTVTSDTSEALISVSIDIQRVGGTRSTVFVWNSDSTTDVVDETSFTYRASDYPDFNGYRVSSEATYDVFVIARDFNDTFEESTHIARIVIPGGTGPSGTQGTSLR